MPKRISTLACLSALLLCSFKAGAADWPRFLGPEANGTAPDRNLNKDWATRSPKVLWTVSLTDNGHAGPSIADGKVFIVDHRGSNDVVRALDLATGSELWAYSYPDATKNRYGFTESTPLFDHGRLYTFSRLGKAHCLDATSGKLIWSRDVRADFAGRSPEWDYSASPAIVDDRLILYPGGAGAAIVALDPLTGQTLWQTGSSLAAYSTPIQATLNGQTQLIAFIGDGLFGIDSATGQQLWHFPWKVDNQQNSATPLVCGNTVFISTAWNKGSVMLDLTGNQPKVLWQSKEMQARFTTPVFSHGRIYGTHNSGKLVCLDSGTGKLLWRQPNFEFASTIAVDDCVIVLEGRSGDLLLIDATTPQYKELSRIHAVPGPECWAAPVISDGRLLVRGKTTLVCLDLRLLP